MKRKTFIFLWTFLSLTNICEAQSDSLSSKDTSLQSKYFNSYNSNFRPNYSLLQTDNIFTYNDNRFNNSCFKLNLSETLFYRPVYYNPLLKRDFSYKFNPINPWNTTDPFEAVISGSLNYIIQAVDRKYFFSNK
jgi:hypothetical protein